MNVKVAIQMDPIENINLASDSTFLLALEAQNRGMDVFYYQPHDLFMKNSKIYAKISKLYLKDDIDDYYKLSDSEIVDLSNMDFILIRQDPPFDMNYLTYTYLLEMVDSKTKIINNPTEIRNSPEKILVNYFQDLIPPTLITSDAENIIDFYNEHKDIIIKPLYAHGGKDVYRIEHISNLKNIITIFKKLYDHPVIIQKFIPQVKVGDKRIIIINGKPEGVVLRVPLKNEIVSNLAVGGTAEITELTKRDMEICEMIGPMLKYKGLYLVGIDVIGDYLTEINVTSPTGIRSIKKLYNVNLAEKFWNGLV